MARTFVVVWEEVGALLAEVDVLLGFAELAACAPTPYVRPTMLPPDDGVIELLGMVQRVLWVSSMHQHSILWQRLRRAGCLCTDAVISC